MKTKINRFIWRYILICFAVLVCYSTAAFSAVPEVINYQGSLSDNGGNPVNSTLNMTFTLYDVDAGPGTILWQEVQSVTVTNGQFSVQLGADNGNPLDITIFEDPLFLGIAVGGDAEMTPRQELTAVGYAVRSKTVENDTLNSLSCASGEVPKWNGTAWACATDDEGAGDITGVTTSNGITGGGTSGDVDISADTTFLQRRVNANCPAGSSIRAIAATGAISCEADDDTNYSAGSGLNLSGTTFSIPPNSVTSIHLAPDAVGPSELAPNSVNSDDVEDDSLTASDLAANSVGASELAVNAVGTIEVQNDSLTAIDMEDEAGADFTGGSQNVLLIGNIDQVIRTVTLDVPSTGLVIVNASGFFFRSGADASGTCVITTLNSSSETGSVFLGTVTTDIPRMTFAGTRGFNVFAGPRTFRLICRSSAGIRVVNSSMTALYVPTRY